MIKQLARLIVLIAVVGIIGWLTEKPVEAQNSAPVKPILVELFTSEGCSSCPPADALLEKLDRLQPVAGAQLIVLSEHVDYWNYIGWKDPYSSTFCTQRQNSYAQHFRTDTVYTPQMVVDGSNQLVGSDAHAADWVFAQAVKAPKIGVRLSAISVEGAKEVKAHVETEVLPASSGEKGSDVYLAVAFNHAESKVSAGENSGRRLTHTGVIRSLIKIGNLRPGQGFAKDVQVTLDPGADPRNMRLIAFIQEPGAGRVLGATMESLSK